MEEMTLQQAEIDILDGINYAYLKSKKLFINTEERLSSMGFFIAPLVEHRAALDHLMRYFRYKQDSGKTQADYMKELEEARAHELRAYFDIADYACIIIRDEIEADLRHISKRKIKKYWESYSHIKTKIVEISKKISEIRNNRTESMAGIDVYDKTLADLFEVYELFRAEIYPQIIKGK